MGGRGRKACERSNPWAECTARSRFSPSVQISKPETQNKSQEGVTAGNTFSL